VPDNGGRTRYRATTVTTLRDELPNACADFCQPRAPTYGGEASNRRLVEHEEPAEIELPLIKIITSQGRTRKGMRVRRCRDRSMPGLARRRSRLREILAKSGRHRAGQAIDQALTAAAEVAAALPARLVEEHNADPERAAAQSTFTTSLKLLRQAREPLGQGLRAAGVGDIAESGEICVRNR